jgi:hypothetical protein
MVYFKGKEIAMRLFEREIENEKNFNIELKGNFSETRKKLPSVRSMINSKQRIVFIKKLFSHKETEYENFINKLETLTNWSAAYEAIEKDFTDRKIDLNKKETVAFTDILFQRYYF